MGGEISGGYTLSYAESLSTCWALLDHTSCGTRSDSKSTRDPVVRHDGLTVPMNPTVTPMVFVDALPGDLAATGVEFASSANGPGEVDARGKLPLLEVGSTQILELSGIGPWDVLEASG